jgi:integrase
MVEVRLQGKGLDDYLFEELQGNPKGLPKRFTRFRNAIFPDLKNSEGQAEKSLHSLRKFWITERIRAGCPPYLVSELAGHKLPGMSLGVYYGGATPEQAQQIVEAAKLWRAPSP